MKERQIIFINQSPNDMLSDVASIYKTKGCNTILLAGQNPLSSEAFDRVKLLCKYNRKSAFMRLITWTCFSFQALVWVLFKRLQNAEVFLVSNPPLLVYIIPLITILKKCKVKLLIYDLYPDIVSQYYKGIFAEVLKLILSVFNRFSLRYASQIYVPSYAMRDAAKKYYSREIKVVYNWVDTDKIKPVAKDENLFLKQNNLAKKFIVLYSGNMGKTHDAETILNAATSLEDTPSVKFVFTGEGEEMKKVEERLRNGSKNISLFPMQDEIMFKHSIASGDIALISYKREFDNYSMPSRLPFLLAAGTPVIAIGNIESETARLLLKENCGFAIESGNSQQLAVLIKRIHETENRELKSNAVGTAKKYFSILNAMDLVE